MLHVAVSLSAGPPMLLSTGCCRQTDSMCACACIMVCRCSSVVKLSSSGYALLLLIAPHTAMWHSAVLCFLQAPPTENVAHFTNQAQSGGKPTSDTGRMLTVPTPSASLLTEAQQRADHQMTRALRAATGNASQAAKAKAARVCLLAASAHLQEAEKITATAMTGRTHAR